MTPMDEFFTSKKKDEFHERQQARKAFAKAQQFRRFADGVPKPHAKAAFAKHLKGVRDPRDCARIYRGHKVQVTGRPALTGFKPPKKKWRHRDSQHPNTK